jgi:tetratricopeptide (TPR) repeat protein
MAGNAFIKIGTALLKHQVKKLVGEETLGVLSEELADIGGDKLDAWLGDKSTIEELKKAAQYAHDCFHDTVGDHDLEQWMVSLPIGDLPKVTDALARLPASPDEKQLENALREAIAGWRKLSPEKINHAVNSFLSCLRGALLPIEKQTLMVIGRSVLRTEDKVNLLLRWFEQYIITGKPVEIKQLNPEPVDYWNLKHPYAMPPNFTGRVEERKMLVDWLKNDSENRLFIVRALGGFGKSALAWHWLTHDVDPKQWTKVLWWSFYEGDANFENFIEETLRYLKLEVPQGQRPQVDELLKAMQGGKILLIMDGFERALRAYSSMNAAYQGDEESKLEDNQIDCVNINAEIFLKSVCSLPSIKSKVLMTTRLTPRAVKPRGEFMLGCREEELTAMQKEDAVEFFHKQKIKGTHAEIEATCAPYGYHPLSLRLLAGRIAKDFENPYDIVVAQKLKIDGDIVQQKHHVLEVSYNSLPSREQKLLSTIACFRSPVEHSTLESIAENKDSLDTDLRDLIDRGLLHFDEKNKKFDIHPIVRRYAYERLTAPDRTAAHIRLRNYFAAIDVPEQPRTIEDLMPVIELYHHMVNAGKLDDARLLFRDRLEDAIYSQFGGYQLQIELLRSLFLDGEGKHPSLKEESAQGWTLNSLANAYASSGQPHRAVPLFKMANDTYENKMKNKQYLAIGLGNVALDQIRTGALKEAERNLRREIDLGREIEYEFVEAVGRYNLGHLLSYRGVWQGAKEELDKSLEWAEKERHVQMQGVIWSDNALCFLLMARANLELQNVNLKSAIKAAFRALQLAEKTTRTRMKTPRDYIRADWLLGAAYLASVVSIPPAKNARDYSTTELTLAEENLSKAISMCRQINAVDAEADILLDLARLRYDQENYEEAKNLAEEALTITERCGYVLQGADVNLFLAQYALEQEKDKVKAKEYAETALKLAYCDGPPYYYKVAYHEAERMLEKL